MSVRSAHLDPGLEQLLKELQFSWTYEPGVPIEEIDIEESLRNQARFAPLDKKTVERYAIAMEAGTDFPAVCAWQPKGNRKRVLVDGNHRIHAEKKLGIKSTDMYVVTGATPQQIRYLTFKVNNRHGLPTDEKTRLEQALYLHDGGMSSEKAAIEMQVNVHRLRALIKEDEVNRRVDEAGIKQAEWERTPKGYRLRLGQIDLNDVFAAAVRLQLQANLSRDELDQMVTRINRIRDHDQQLEFIKNQALAWTDRIRQGGMGGKVKAGRGELSPRVVAWAAINQVQTLPTPASVIDRMTTADKAELKKAVRAAKTRLADLEKALGEKAPVE